MMECAACDKTITRLEITSLHANEDALEEAPDSCSSPAAASLGLIAAVNQKDPSNTLFGCSQVDIDLEQHNEASGHAPDLVVNDQPTSIGNQVIRNLLVTRIHMPGLRQQEDINKSWHHDAEDILKPCLSRSSVGFRQDPLIRWGFVANAPDASCSDGISTPASSSSQAITSMPPLGVVVGLTYKELSWAAVVSSILAVGWCACFSALSHQSALLMSRSNWGLSCWRCCWYFASVWGDPGDGLLVDAILCPILIFCWNALKTKG
ncbi:hypothetical protein Nepgr_030877 [Nepenthes gracilis]|uniref:Uncharacterized protein n=1 Tax=Nepenthes gracilis TaxID=150966 RepID=A0AAD3TH10_NEPGR|nr:hypothetical protein Nepgr_030877 [Nepenthes gracilis]